MTQAKGGNRMDMSRRNFFKFSGLGSLSLLSKKVIANTHYPLIQEKKQNIRMEDVWIEIDYGNLSWNLKQVQAAAEVPVMAVIKANGYGHGLTEVGLQLDRLGIHSFMVGKFYEAVQLRSAGVSCPIHNFGPLSAADTDWMVENDVSQSVFTDGIEPLVDSALRVGKKAIVHVHVDTGMGRMGIPYRKAGPYIERLSRSSGIRIAGISTTLTEDPDYDKIQMDRFNALCRELNKAGIPTGFKHAGSSAALFGPKSFHLDMVRPGIVLYGYYPSDKTQAEDRLELKPILQLKARVAAVKSLQPGDSVSYHRAYTAKKRETMAVLPIGYSDGYPTGAAGRGTVLIKGQHCPIIASITANHMEVLLPEESSVSVGEEAILIGRQGETAISAVDIARWTGLSSYKILLSLNPLLSRITL